MVSSTSGSLEGLRGHNRERVVHALSRSGLASRAELARLTGLSRTTVSSLVAELIGAGLVVEREDVPGAAPGPGGGRPPVLLALDRSAGSAVGVDFGHSHIRVAVADLSHTVLAEEVIDFDVDGESAAALDRACALVEDAIEQAGVARAAVVGVGVGLPGPIRLGSRMLGSPTILPGWTGMRIADVLEERLGLKVMLENDANLGALAELSFGAARGERFAVYVRAYSGIGAGLICDGRLYRGADGTAGELGHVIIDESGPVCRCGNRGCLETVAAEGAILDLLRRTHGDDLTFPRVVELAAGGDAACRRVIADAGHQIGVAVANLCNIFNPSMVVVGGTLSGAGDLLLDPLRDAVSRYAIASAAQDVSVVRGVLGERAEVLGALALVFAEGEGAFPLRVAVGGAA
ncbi:MAG TPA: ROK family transcriptional regulator [Solirubrobacteraceae bacterium]|nr:ROK family transcriptional regulator [Solirubrobacteraceae bacterium]